VLVLDGGVGSQFSEVEDGAFTGRPTGLFVYGSEKALPIKQLPGRERIDLAASYACSDSASDLPMLRAVGHPVAVNPDGELLRVAREQRWHVLRFEPLGRRLKAGVALAGATAVGGDGQRGTDGRRRGRTLFSGIPAVGRGGRRRVAVRVR
jgi:haloacid dehalogenase-like hydrolase